MSFTQAQQELSLHFLQNLPQANFTNPAYISSQKTEIILPSIYYNLYTPDFNINNLFSTNENGVRDLNEVAKTTLGIRNRIITHINATTLGIAYTLKPKWRINVSHSYHANMSADIDGTVIKALTHNYSKNIGKTFFFNSTLNGNFYHQLAIGGSYQHNDHIDYGVRLKILKGISSVFTQSGQSYVTIEDYNYATSYDNHIDVLGFSIEDIVDIKTMKGLLKESLNLRNLGVGLDIGAVYRISKWQFSASIIDALSVLNWKKKGKNYIGTGLHRFSGVGNIRLFQSSQSSSFSIEDTLKNILGLKILDNAQHIQRLPTKLYVSALYNLNAKLRLGGLIYGEWGGGFPFQESLMIQASYKIIDNFELGSSWSLRHKRLDNIGLHLMGQYKTLQVFGATDNIFTIFEPYNHKSANLRLGVNLILK